MENCSKSELLEQHLLREALPRFRPGERIPSEQEMADRLNTSRTTMHKVYFNLMSRGLIYRRNGVGTFVAEPPAPPKPAVPARMITAVMPSLHLLNAKETPNWFNHQYTLEYFADAAREDNFILNVVFLDHDRHSPDEAEKLLNRADVPAFLFSSLVPEHAPIIERLTAAGKTCVGRYFGRADFCHSVWFDMENAFLLAVKHLAGTGRKRIALLDSWSPELPQIPHYGYPIMRYRMFRRALEQAGLPFIAGLYRFCPPSMSDGEWAARRMLEEGLRFDAILCGTDQRAFGVLGALRKAGVRVPDDVAVIGLNNEAQCAECDPPLASIEVSYRAIARELYVLLRELLASPLPPGEFTGRACPGRFIWRESAGGGAPA